MKIEQFILILFVSYASTSFAETIAEDAPIVRTQQDNSYDRFKICFDPNNCMPLGLGYVAPAEEKKSFGACLDESTRQYVGQSRKHGVRVDEPYFNEVFRKSLILCLNDESVEKSNLSAEELRKTGKERHQQLKLELLYQFNT